MNNNPDDNLNKEKALKIWREYYFPALNTNIGFSNSVELKKITNPKILGFIHKAVIKTNTNLSLREDLIQKVKEQLSIEFVQGKHFFVFIPTEYLGDLTFALVEVE